MNLNSSSPPLTNILFEVSTSAISIKSHDLDLKLAISHDLSYPILFTGLTFPSPNIEKAKHLFKIVEIETFLEHNNDKTFIKPLGFQEVLIEKGLSYHAVAFISSFRVNFIINMNPNSNNPDMSKLFLNYFTSVQIHGFSLNISPNSSSVIPLLNISELFNKNKRFERILTLLF